MYLKKVQVLKERVESVNEYPFTIPAIRTLEELHFNECVTFFVGENGSGKSTLLEAIADKCDFNVAGGGRNNLYDLDASESALADYIRLSWMPKTTNGFFLRAESFYQFATHVDSMIGGTQAYGGRSLHHQSHGESFMSLFQNRFGEQAIYLLDEPEAALSPQRQLAFLKLMHDLVEQGDCQFIIATHSPILLGYPNAKIYNFDNETIEPIAYEETSHYQITKYFLHNRERFLHELFKEDE